MLMKLSQLFACMHAHTHTHTHIHRITQLKGHQKRTSPTEGSAGAEAPRLEGCWEQWRGNLPDTYSEPCPVLSALPASPRQNLCYGVAGIPVGQTDIGTSPLSKSLAGSEVEPRLHTLSPCRLHYLHSPSRDIKRPKSIHSNCLMLQMQRTNQWLLVRGREGMRGGVREGQGIKRHKLLCIK